MCALQINFASKAISINGQSWTSAPPTEGVCQAIGAYDLVDGPPILYDGNPGKRFRYFENLGLSILEIISTSRVQRVTVHMETPLGKRAKPLSNAKHSPGQRPTEKPFTGVLELNRKQLRSPLRFSQFPLLGDLRFIHRIAMGESMSASVAVKLRFVERVNAEFRAGIEF